MKTNKNTYDELIKTMMEEADRLERLEDLAFGPYRKTVLTDALWELRCLIDHEYEEED